MNQHIISRIAIFLLSIAMIFFGIQHFIHPQNMVTRVPDFLPGGIVWVYIVGVAFILAAISFMSNILVRTAAYLLALMLFIFVFTIHLPQYFDTADKDYKQATLVNLLKDLALAAFALYIASNARHQKVLEETSLEEESLQQRELA
jgi:putative oxidoreductase